MIAKLSTHAPTREKAVEACGKALDRFEISGIAHNIPFLDAVMHSPRFREGRFTTHFIAEEYPSGFRGAPLDEADLRLFVAAAVATKLCRTQRAGEISGALKNALRIGDSFVVEIAGHALAVCDAHLAVGSLHLMVDGKIFEAVVDWFPGRPLLVLKHRGQETAFQIARHAGFYRLAQGGRELDIAVRSPHAARLAALMPRKTREESSRLVVCPMPGLVAQLHAREGQEVKAGDPLAVIEAMKMENVLTAERDGKVAKVLVKKGDNLARDEVILEFAESGP